VHKSTRILGQLMGL